MMLVRYLLVRLDGDTRVRTTRPAPAWNEICIPIQIELPGWGRTLAPIQIQAQEFVTGVFRELPAPSEQE